MAVIEGGVSLALAGVGMETASPLHVALKPIPYDALGHYRTALRINSTAAQAANSRILTLRNTHASNLLIPTRLLLRAIQTAAGTAQENSLDVYKATGFTVSDTVNTVTPTSSVMRTTMAAYPGAAEIRHLTLTGAAAGMTGGTLTKNAQFIATLPYNVAAAINVNAIIGPLECLDDRHGGHPLVLAQNEGLVIENRVLNVTSYGITWYLDLAWCEVSVY
jgi:hypothetical protein